MRLRSGLTGCWSQGCVGWRGQEERVIETAATVRHIPPGTNTPASDDRSDARKKRDAIARPYTIILSTALLFFIKFTIRTTKLNGFFLS